MIDQISASYDQHEDRVLFRFNTTSFEEYAFWLSRKIVKHIINSIPRHSQEGLVVFQKIRNDKLKPIAKPDLGDKSIPASKGALSKETNDKTPSGRERKTFRSGQSFPIGNNPVLVVKFNQKDVDNKLCLEFRLTDGRDVSLRVSNGLFLKMHSLLEAILIEANWDIPDFGSPLVAQQQLN